MGAGSMRSCVCSDLHQRSKTVLCFVSSLFTVICHALFFALVQNSPVLGHRSLSRRVLVVDVTVLFLISYILFSSF